MNQSKATNSIADIELRIEAVRSQLDPDQFTNGRCHDFAVALQMVVGGDLFIILRHEVEEDGSRFSTTYSHSILCLDGEDYDIWGAGAGERWEGQWDNTQDKWGMHCEFEYQGITLPDLPAFLASYDVALDEAVIRSVTTALGITRQQAA